MFLQQCQQDAGGPAEVDPVSRRHAAKLVSRYVIRADLAATASCMMELDHSEPLGPRPEAKIWELHPDLIQRPRSLRPIASLAIPSLADFTARLAVPTLSVLGTR